MTSREAGQTSRPAGRPDLHAIARAIMAENGFHPDFPTDVAADLAAVTAAPPRAVPAGGVQDLRGVLWSSIDNDTSRDLDQVEAAERQPDGKVRVRVGIADVDAFVPASHAIDRHAGSETTTVYAGIENFPMLPEALSTDATSLVETGDRLSVVIDFLVGADGGVVSGDVYRAVIRNRAQLAYDGVGAWLDGGAAPAKVAASTDLQAQLRLQHDVASVLRTARHQHGALDIDTIETHPVVLNNEVVDLVRQRRNPATELIEDFMIAANGVVARLLEAKGIASIRRVVRTPKRWDRIVALAAEQGGRLPDVPDPKALNDFLSARNAADPDRFPDLSLAVIKLLGPGEYVLERPGGPSEGHFGLAVQDYTHSTAPNRRYADLVSQRLLKAMLAGQPSPYADEALGAIADRCTKMEDAARKVEREMSKRIAAVAMSRRIGEVFDAIVTGVTPRGTFVRVLAPHVEGLLASGAAGVDVGDRLRVRLTRTDPDRGFIDFART
jgi:VacB/RNase II family 3'-5' exoribonuclease